MHLGRVAARYGSVYHLDDRTALGRFSEQRRRTSQVVGPEHDVHVARTLANDLPVLLRQAASDRYLHPRSLLSERFQRSEMSVEAVIRILPYAARIEHDDICLGHVVDGLEPVSRQERGDPL
jgi:hypothetical protein